MAIESVGSQTPVTQNPQREAAGSVRSEEKESRKVEDDDARQNDRADRAEGPIKETDRGASIDITG